MRRILRGLALVLSLSAPAAAFGDSVFNLNGTLADGTGTFTGTLAYNQPGVGLPQGTVTDGSFSFTLPSNYLGEVLGEGNYVLVDAFAVNAVFDLVLEIPDAVFTQGGGALCSLSYMCPGDTKNVTSFFTDGNLFPEQQFQTLTATSAVSATPEPGTLALLGTGLLAMVGLLRQRLRGFAR